jgi:hypothetical protein
MTHCACSSKSAFLVPHSEQKRCLTKHGFLHFEQEIFLSNIVSGTLQMCFEAESWYFAMACSCSCEVLALNNDTPWLRMTSYRCHHPHHHHHNPKIEKKSVKLNWMTDLGNREIYL